MSKAEEFAQIASTNERLAAEEVQSVLRKYGVSIHFAEQKIDGQTVQANMFFKFEPNNFLNNTSPK